jgi:hypothetical protein
MIGKGTYSSLQNNNISADLAEKVRNICTSTTCSLGLEPLKWHHTNPPTEYGSYSTAPVAATSGCTYTHGLLARTQLALQAITSSETLKFDTNWHRCTQQVNPELGPAAVLATTTRTGDCSSALARAALNCYAACRNTTQASMYCCHANHLSTTSTNTELATASHDAVCHSAPVGLQADIQHVVVTAAAGSPHRCNSSVIASYFHRDPPLLVAAPEAAELPRAVVAPAAALPAAMLLLLRMYTPLCLMDMVEDTSVTRLLMTPLVRAVIGTLASALVLFLQATTPQNKAVISTVVPVLHVTTQEGNVACWQ